MIAIEGHKHQADVELRQAAAEPSGPQLRHGTEIE